MPTYEYRCEKCGDFEVSQKITEDPLSTCPTCGGPVIRLVSAAAFHLKGTGWYKTDYASSSSSNGASSSSASSGETKSETKTNSPESTTTSTAGEKTTPPKKD